MTYLGSPPNSRSYIGNGPVVSSTRTVTEVVATAGQTAFTPTGGYTVGFIDVFVNGAQLQSSDFVATNGTTISLNSGASASDDIRLVAWGTFSAANTYTQSATDALLATKVNTSTTTAFKNRIINGDMRIDQRNAGASVTPTGSAYTLDRWQLSVGVASKLSVQQSSTAPAGFRNSVLITTASAYTASAGDYLSYCQVIEGYNVADLNFGNSNAKTFTLSFWVRSSLTGTFSGALQATGAGRSYPFTFTISAANTFEYKTVTVAGDTTGTWNTTNGKGMEVHFNLGSGSDRLGTAGAWNSNWNTGATGSVALVQTAGATFYLTGVQLEVGSSATPFDTRAYGTELALCQRYYWRRNASNGAYTAFASGWVAGSTDPRVAVVYPVEMRSQPTFNQSNTGFNTGAAIVAFSSFGTTWAGLQSSQVQLVTASGLTTGHGGAWFANNNSAAWIDASAEL